MSKHKIIVLILLSVFIYSPFINVNKANAATFDPGNIMSDYEIFDADSMSLGEIEAFLRSKDGYISKNHFLSSDNELKSAAQIIYEAAHNYDCSGITLSNSPNRAEREQKCRYAPINPKLLLVLLQKEQSLIEAKTPTQKQLDWATGYAVCDSCAMDDPTIQRWRGFGKQINSASLQFSDYMRNPKNYGFIAGKSYNISSTGRQPMPVTIQNQATAALYNYTPHVYWGNYNFFKLWMRYFTRTYPNNSLLQARGETGVWLIQDGKRRPFLSRGALTSRYDINKVIQVSKADLEKYAVGSPLKFSQYSLVRSPGGHLFLLIDDNRRGFVNQEAFRKLGFNPEEIVDATWDDIHVYNEIEPITATSSYPTGALLQDKSTGGVFYARNGTKAPLWDRVLLDTKFKRMTIFPIESEKLANFKTVEPEIFDDGELLTPHNSPAVYVIDNHKRRPIVSGKAFEELGYKWENIISVPEKIINLYEEGEAIGQKFEEAKVETIDPKNPLPDSNELETSNEIELELELMDEINNILNPL